MKLDTIKEDLQKTFSSAGFGNFEIKININDTLNEKFESLYEAINNIEGNVQQILQAITTGAGAFSMFGGPNGGGLSGLVKALGEKIKNSSWWQEHVGAGGEKGGGGSSNSGAYKKYADRKSVV